MNHVGNECEIFVGKLEGKRPGGRLWHR